MRKTPAKVPQNITMKKEVLIAIFIGISFGLIITFGIHTAQRSIRNRDLGTNADTPTTPIPENIQNASNHIMTVNSPQSNAVIEEAQAEITGITSPLAMISAISAADQSAAQADDQGNFAIVLELETGANQVIITSYNANGQEVSQELTLVHSTANLEENNTPEEPETDKKGSDEE